MVHEGASAGSGPEFRYQEMTANDGSFLVPSRSGRVMRTYQYGAQESQTGDLYISGDAQAPVVCLLHGGFWRMPYGREQFEAVASNLMARGFAVWNLGYRRVGEPGGGWPGTLDDVAAGVDHLATVATEVSALDLARVVIVGHSAGGQLALWAAGRRPDENSVNRVQRVRPIGVAALAAVSDLANACELACGNGAVSELLGGSQLQLSQRYAVASPLELLPLGKRQLIVHGSADLAVPVQMSRRYAQAALAAGDDVQYHELPDAGHMDYLDPDTEAHAVLCKWLALVT